MKFEEYERTHYFQYQRFAEAMRTILDRAIASAENVPRPQSIQARAKTPKSLKKRLIEAAALAVDVDTVRRVPAGVRVVFYTNNDVDQFLNPSRDFDNFEVVPATTKLHHPPQENERNRFSAIHYPASLSATRA